MTNAILKSTFVILFACSQVTAQEVNRSFSYVADLTGDGQKERIVLNIHGADIKRPFIWSLTVADPDGRMLFQLDKDDAWIDEAYGDPNYMSGCSGYEQCKRRYYFKEKPDLLSKCLKGGDALRSAKFFGFANSSEAARQFLEGRSASPETIVAALKELELTLQSKRTLALCYQVHEEDHGNFFVWLNTVSDFVPFYVP